jgi:hypothetical protein
MTPMIGSQTKAKRMSLVSGVVAWAWVMDVLKKQASLISLRGASEVRGFI